MFFEACESNNFTISVPFEGLYIAGMLWPKCCKSLLFRELSQTWCCLQSQSQLSQLFLKVPLNSTYLYYILYIYLIINKLYGYKETTPS